jgi:hypothetical protein
MKINLTKLPPIDRINLGDNLKEVRKNQDDIVLESGITILSQQPGIGKTTLLKKYLQETDEKWVLTVPNHKLIESEYEKIKRISGVKAWKGFPIACTKYNDGNPHVRKLKDKHGLNAGFICSNACTKEEMRKCGYRKQFKKPKNVITVSAYHNTQYFYDKGKFKFDIAVIDESLQGYKELVIKIDEIKQAIDTIYNYIDKPVTKIMFMDMLKHKELFSNEENLGQGRFIIEKVADDQKEAIKIALKQKESDIQTINKLRIYDIIKWFYYYSIHGEDRTYSDPYIYRIFDLARQGVKVVFADASFSLKLFQALLGRYQFEESIISRSILLQKELKPIEDVKIKMYSSQIRNVDTTIYRMWEENFFYKNYLQEMEEELQEFIDQARRKHPNIGIITYEKHVKLFNEEYQTTHFGNLRGLNTFEKKDAIFLIGSYLTNHEGILNDYNALFFTNYEMGIDASRPVYKATKKDDPNFEGDYYQQWTINGKSINYTIPGGFNEKIPEPVQEIPKEYEDLQQNELKFIEQLKEKNEVKVDINLLNELKLEEGKKNGLVDIHTFYPLNHYDRHLIDSEIYQAIHRARPINNPIIPIYVFGYIPSNITDEFNVIKKDNKKTEEYFMTNFKGVYPSTLVGAILNFSFKNRTYDSLSVAREFNLYKGITNQYNTPFVTYIRNGNVTTTEVNRINDLIKNGVHKIEEFQKEYKKLKKQALLKDEDFINFVKWCIYYAVGENDKPIKLPSY